MQPEDVDFWDFSWHEIGVFDIPSTIDYILDQTNQTKLSYVGHSQGEKTTKNVHTRNWDYFNLDLSILRKILVLINLFQNKKNVLNQDQNYAKYGINGFWFWI